ncbi:MAG TPA: EamA family transporter [Lachnospiraceae bacterium]|nr:EamA family transporter [Lachnospiraceae bacterium]
MNNIISYMILLGSVLMASFSQILLKKSALIKYKSMLKEYVNPYVIIGYGMLFGSMLATIIAYSKLEYKNGPMIESLGFVLVMFLSFLIFKERLTKRKVMGSLLIITGIMIFNM